jgi:hypothetical protein
LLRECRPRALSTQTLPPYEDDVSYLNYSDDGRGIFHLITIRPLDPLISSESKTNILEAVFVSVLRMDMSKCLLKWFR